MRKIDVNPIGRLRGVCLPAVARIAEPRTLFFHFGLIVEDTAAGPDDRFVVIERPERESEPRREDVLGRGAISAAAGIPKHIAFEMIIEDRLVRGDDTAAIGCVEPALVISFFQRKEVVIIPHAHCHGEPPAGFPFVLEIGSKPFVN